MSAMEPIRKPGSLLERAAEVYDFGAAFRGEGVADHGPPTATWVAPPRPILRDEPVPADEPAPLRQAKPVHVAAAAIPGAIDRRLLAERGLLVPGAPIGALAEEFRLVKRQLLLTARAVQAVAGNRSRTILICSANIDEGKTFCAVNLALSMAAERDVEVVLVDADFAKPDVMARLGLADGPGLLDALADPAIDIEHCVVRTDVPQLSILPAGTKSTSDTELLASDQTPRRIKQLLDADPRRILIFDSPPALAASPAATLALQVGQIMLVVRADQTTESDLREAVSLLSGCEHIQLVLNAVRYAPGGRRYGSYYSLEEAQ